MARLIEPERRPILRPRPRPSLKLATWLSILPGGGQLYNRQPRKAVIFFGGVVALFFLAFNIPAATDLLLSWWLPRGGTMVLLSLIVQMLSLLVFCAVFLGALTFWYGAMHDARLTAKETNRAEVARGRWWLFRK